VELLLLVRRPKLLGRVRLKYLLHVVARILESWALPGCVETVIELVIIILELGLAVLVRFMLTYESLASVWLSGSVGWICVHGAHVLSIYFWKDRLLSWVDVRTSISFS